MLKECGGDDFVVVVVVYRRAEALDVVFAGCGDEHRGDDVAVTRGGDVLVAVVMVVVGVMSWW